MSSERFSAGLPVEQESKTFINQWQVLIVSFRRIQMLQFSQHFLSEYLNYLANNENFNDGSINLKILTIPLFKTEFHIRCTLHRKN